MIILLSTWVTAGAVGEKGIAATVTIGMAAKAHAERPISSKCLIKRLL
jgi:hypothetical protein